MGALLACEVLQPTKMGHGQTYESGDGKYDPYFASVHQEQKSAGGWPEEANTSRKSIVSALALKPDASNSRILREVRTKQGDSSLASAIEQTTTSETARARRLQGEAVRLDEVRRKGEDLKRQATAERENLGADKADREKRDKKDEVKREVSAAVDSVKNMAIDARNGARDAAELASKLKAAWTGKAEDERPMLVVEEPKEEKKPEPPKEEKKAEERHEERKKPRAESPPAPKKPAKPEAKPEPEEKKPAEEKRPKAPSSGSDEVFTP
jgi:hypothetical protein